MNVCTVVDDGALPPAWEEAKGATDQQVSEQEQTQSQAQQQGNAVAPYTTPGAVDARAAVQGILNGNNSCSQFLSSNLNGQTAAQVFSAVDIGLNPDAKPTVMAETNQGSLADGPIFLNPSGAFFKASALSIDPQRGPYAPEGGSLRAQEIILFHELGHKVNALASDKDSPAWSQVKSDGYYYVMIGGFVSSGPRLRAEWTDRR